MMARTMKFGVAAILAGMALVAAAQNPPATPAKAAKPVEVDRVVAIVGDEAITLVELRQRMTAVERRLREQKIPLPPKDVLEKQMMERLVTDKVQLQFAKESGLRISDGEVDGALRRIADSNRLTMQAFRAAVEGDGIPWTKFREDIRDEITLGQLREREVSQRAVVTEGEIDNYLENPQLQGAEEVNIAHIFLRLPESASPDQVTKLKARADQALAQIRKGDDFGKVAASFSDAPDGLSGGVRGFMPIDRQPTLYAEAIQKMQPGDVSDVLRSPAGFHVVKLLERKGGNINSATYKQTRARHILVKVSEIVSENEARRKLADLKERIDHGADFADLARLHSADLSGAKGGDLGWLYQGDTVPEFERVMDSLKINEVSPPIQSPFGWHLIQVLERRTEVASSDRKRQQARNVLRERKADEVFDDWVRQQRDRTYVELRLEDK